MMSIGNMKSRVGNNRVANIVGATGETTVNSNGKKFLGATGGVTVNSNIRKLVDFCTFNKT